MSRSRVPKLLSLLYNHNPFYLISACLFVYGLKLLFRAGDSAVLFQRGSVAYMEPWGLMASLAGVTVLMAVTAVLVVRLGRVWEDARSLVLTVLLMLLAISVSFDEIITLLSDRDNSRQHLFMMFGVGLCFAVGLCELLVRGLGLRLLLSYRLPLYGFMVLFFAWPGLLLPELTHFTDTQTRWLIVAFPVVAAGMTLTLIPAVRRGSTAVANNGTPWTWPLFPWTPFVFIALAVCFRSYSLTMSFDAVALGGHYWDTMFGLYQLVPFALAVLVILLEISVVENRPQLQRKVVFVAPILLVFASPNMVPWSRLPSYSAFTDTLVSNIASPVFLTVIGLAVFYAYAWMRRVRHAEPAFYLTAFFAAVIDPKAYGARIWEMNLESISWWPLLVLALIQIGIGASKKQSLRFFAGLLLATMSGHLATSAVPQLYPWRGLISLHAVLLSVLLIGGLFKDEFAKAMEELGPMLLSGTMLWTGTTVLQSGWPIPNAAIYALLMTVAALILHQVLKNRHYLVVALVHCGIGMISGCVFGVVTFFRAALPQGTKPLALAVISFLLAVLISVLKSGLSRRIRMCWILRQRSAGRAQ